MRAQRQLIKAATKDKTSGIREDICRHLPESNAVAISITIAADCNHIRFILGGGILTKYSASITPILSILLLLTAAATSLAATEFSLRVKNSEEDIHCEFLAIKKQSAYCTTNEVAVAYPLDEVERIHISFQGKDYTITEITSDKYDKITQAVYNVNRQKLQVKLEHEQSIREEQRKQQERERRRREQAERYRAEVRSLCQEDCAINPYEYDKSCYAACLRQRLAPE